MDGLPTEYQDLVSIIQYHDELCVVIVVETMLLSHEASLERAPLTHAHKPHFVNLTQGTTATTLDSTLSNNVSEPQDAQSQMPSHEFVSSFDGTCGDFRCGRSIGFHGGCRNGSITCIQCKICYKFGQDAKVCYHCLLVTP